MRTRLTSRLLAAHVLALVLVTAAALLGWWQLQVWRAERQAAAVDLTQADPVPLTDLMGPDDGFPGESVGQPVTLSGTWLDQGTVLVEGRPRAGERGLWVVTPLEVEPGSAVPVVTGWVPDRADAPAPPQGRAEVAGWLQPPDGQTGAVDDDPTDDVLPQLRIADLVQRVDDDLYSAYVISRDGIDGLPAAELAELPGVTTFTGAQNFLYAVEWWVFGGFAGLVWWRFVQESREEPVVGDRVASGV
ncbi:SURF1 family protein [Nocardioides litoris]|uniref:SURF1 family protein n=1 Tax=Nocardioides litoris TaxID=1926648 RepID=UPI0014769DD6|nr:SURF1 family protein [Nocardioides litoris]